MLPQAGNFHVRLHAPRGGFSRKIVALLQEQKVEFKHFDILTDESVPQGKVDVIHTQLTSPDVTDRDPSPNIEGRASTNGFLRIRERNREI